MKVLIVLFFVLTLTFLTSGNAIALTSFGSAYRYKLEMSKDDKVCRHMEKVYKKHFRRPWAYQAKIWGDDKRARNVFIRLPGVEFDSNLAQLMTYSRLPSTPEFEVIPWREGRNKFIREMPDNKVQEYLSPLLVADFDIDNDGKIETVIQEGFFQGMLGSISSFSVYPVGTVAIKDLVGASVFKPRDVQGTRLIDGIESIPGVKWDIKWRSLRPFFLNGVIYLSGARFETPYGRFEPNHIYKDYMDVLKYIKGSRFMKGSDQPPLEFETICRFRMTEIPQTSKGE